MSLTSIMGSRKRGKHKTVTKEEDKTYKLFFGINKYPLTDKKEEDPYFILQKFDVEKF